MKTRGGSAMLICLRCDTLTEPVSFRAESRRVLATCGQCRGEVQIGELSANSYTLLPEPESLPLQPFAPPPSYCPKCIAPLGGGAMTCPRCGLDTARADARDAQPPALLSEAWKGLVADWKRPDAHAALTRLAERLDLLEPLGRLYQGYLETRPEDRLAKQARHEVGQLMALGAARPSPSGTHAAMA